MRHRRLAIAVVAALAGVPAAGASQGITAGAPLLDSARLAPFRRDYRMLVHLGDSTVVIGQRAVSAEPSRIGSAFAWLVVETRSGAVPAAESLYVSASGRPLQWSASLGPSRLVFAFVRDSVLGAVSTPAGRQNVVQPAPQRLVVSTAMLELMLRGVRWDSFRSDSVAVLAVDHAGSLIVPAELAVIGEDVVAEASLPAPRPAWIVALRAEGPRTVLFWVDKDDGSLLRLQQPLPLHVGRLLEYRPGASP